MTKRYLDRREAADYLGGISERKLDLLVVNEGLPRILLGRRVMFDLQDLDQFLSLRKQTGRVGDLPASTPSPPALVAA